MSKSTFCLCFISLLALYNPLNAQRGLPQTWALKPYSITLPQVNSTQQSTSATQGAGNIVYNTDQQRPAFTNGSTWQYLATSSELSNDYPNFTAFGVNTTNSNNPPQFWTIPAGVTKFVVELWGGGAGAGVYANSTCAGGAAGGYARALVPVISGLNTVTLTVGKGGLGAWPSVPQARTNGGNSSVSYGNSFFYPPSNSTEYPALVAGGGTNNSATPYLYDKLGPNFTAIGATLIPGGTASPISIAYTQKNTTDYLLTLGLSNGGTAYSVTPGTGGFGSNLVLLNNFTLVYPPANVVDSGIENGQRGSFPSGGGGCGYAVGGNGADGLIIIRW